MGPRMELSTTVLEDGQQLEYVCRENSQKEGNTLCRFQNGQCVDVGKPC